MKNKARKFFGTMAVALALLSTPALAECGPKGSITAMREAVAALDPVHDAKVIELNEAMIASVKAKAGEPPQAEVKGWFVMYYGDTAFLALTDNEDCIRTTLGPVSKQQMKSLLSIEDVTN